MGGSHFSSLTLIENLKPNYDIIIGIHKKGLFYNYCKKNKIKFYFLNKDFFSNKKKTSLNIIHLLLNFYSFLKFIKKNNIDIIHINDFRMLNTWALVSYLAKLKKIIFHQRSKMSKSFMVNLNLNFVTNIISISKFVFFTLEKFNQKKSRIIINPIKKIKYKKKNQTNTIGFVGNDYKMKRLDIFYKFALELIKKKTKFNFVVIGNISNESIDRVYKKYPILKKKLKFTKFLQNPFQIMQSFKFIICPSEKDGFGRVPLEAAYLNVPCILSYSGGHKEFKRFNLCLYAKKNKPLSYLNAYKKILNSKIRKKLIANAINYNKKYTIPKVHTENIIKVYKSL